VSEQALFSSGFMEKMTNDLAQKNPQALLRNLDPLKFMHLYLLVFRLFFDPDRERPSVPRTAGYDRNPGHLLRAGNTA